MLREILIAPQEILVQGFSGIPGGIHIIIIAAKLHNIPAMAHTIAHARKKPAVNAFLQCQPVNQQRIALTHSGMVKNCRMNGIFPLIVRIICMFLIIGDMAANISINRLQLVIIILSRQFQLVSDF